MSKFLFNEMLCLWKKVIIYHTIFGKKIQQYSRVLGLYYREYPVKLATKLLYKYLVDHRKYYNLRNLDNS